MIVAFDASILIYVIDEQAKPPIDPATGKPVDRCHERVMHLLESLQQQNAKIVIPTPGRLGVIKIAEIPLPPETAQRKLPFETNDQGSSKP